MNSCAPLISAIVPTYRRPALLDRSLGSVLAQTWRPLELVVVDDESGDETPAVLEAFAARAREADVAYQWLTQTNAGAGAARNAAMAKARGRWLAFLDDDDEWLPAKLTRQMEAMGHAPQARVCFTQYTHAEKNVRAKPSVDHLRDGWCFGSLCSGGTRAHLQTLLVDAELARQCGGFGAWRNWQDMEFTLRLALHAPFVALAEPLTVIHTESSSISREQGLEGDLRRDWNKLAILDEFAARQAGHPRYDAEAVKLLRARLYDEHVKHLLWLGRVREADHARRRALKECGAVGSLPRLARKVWRARLLGLVGLRPRKP
jgi:glycosyltransferase involved in cell wall biosynthesis